MQNLVGDYCNPFLPDDNDRFNIWELLIRRDFEAFLRQDWEAVQGDYLSEEFHGIDFQKTPQSSSWKLGYPSLASYRTSWLSDSAKFNQTPLFFDPRKILYACCRLEYWDLQADIGIVHKVFDGVFPVHGKNPIEMRWRSIFILRRSDAQWKIAGFVGYIPL